ncbi:winged helix-turn-helix transcriptional regulator [Chryseobacterium chendengshani]|uniref:winged helix-turn-helix transcriptional regulator n=1 Tax=unclassified Chryseobacterium TaxID=2593645 RepID=UPI001C640D08|nr:MULTISPECIES: helix-turn-helix domain-containing protein [unclassified Chryseobacterium]MBW7674555.1 helix-turn-helix transcriptional regulator [Chryseobacterium sp. LJ756]MBW8522652.1 helix-turn-helix transcriptional regulator [Chryseobacterium sp. LJ668]QYK16189.1 helix-turn-helix transcriptional regulator [Chryseobacterium sp. LJ668]
MRQEKIKQCSCALGKAMSALGSKWKPIIILVIKDRTLRFGEIAARISVISRKVLTDQLREMEEDNLLTRHEFKELPPRVEYHLTEKGLALLPILNLLEEWEKEFDFNEKKLDVTL